VLSVDNYNDDDVDNDNDDDDDNYNVMIYDFEKNMIFLLYPNSKI